MSDTMQAFSGSAENSTPSQKLAQELESRMNSGSTVPAAYISDIDETQYCSEGLPGRDSAELDRASESLKQLLESMHRTAGTKIVHNTGKEFPWSGYQVHRTGTYTPILASPDAVIGGGGAHILVLSEDKQTLKPLKAWHDKLSAEAGTDNLWPVVEAFSQADPRIQMLGREWSKEQFIEDDLRVPCRWVSNEPFNILEVDKLVKQALGPHLSAFIYTGFPNAFDIRPESMNKRDSTFFLLDHWGIDPLDSVFSGDSMNDYHLLADDRLNRTVVANASVQLSNSVRAATSKTAPGEPKGGIYFAQGDEVAAYGVIRGIEDMMNRKNAPAPAPGTKLDANGAHP